MVEVSAGDPKEGLYTKTTQCIIVFVAVDDGGTPVEVKRWEPESEQDIALEQSLRSSWNCGRTPRRR